MDQYLDKFKINKQIISKWKLIKFISEGKDGFVIKVQKGSTLGALKIFKHTKSIKKIQAEIKFLKKAEEAGLSPKILSDWKISDNSKCFITEFMPNTLGDFIKNKKLNDKHIKRIIKLYTGLDKLKILHNDSNITRNIIAGDDEVFYLIDFGFSKKLTGKNTNCVLLGVLNNIVQSKILQNFVIEYEKKSGIIIDIRGKAKRDIDERMKKTIARMKSSNKK